MELTTAMLADGAHLAEGKLYVLGGQWDRLMVASFPAQHPTMAVVLVIKVEYTEALSPHPLEIKLMLDGQQRSAGAVGQVVTGHAPGQARGAPSFVALAPTFNNLIFETPGRYEWVVTVDGDNVLGRLPMDVAQGVIPGMPTPVPPPSS